MQQISAVLSNPVRPIRGEAPPVQSMEKQRFAATRLGSPLVNIPTSTVLAARNHGLLYFGGHAGKTSEAPAEPTLNDAEHNPFLAQVYQFNRVADMLGLSPAVKRILANPYREVKVQVVLRRDNGSLESFDGYRIQHNGARGPYKGGIKYHPHANLDEVRSLASGMTWKTALMDLPLGGAKGGIQFDPRNYSQGEIERITRDYTRKISRFIGPETDIPAPDVNTNAKVMGWMVDEFGRLNGSLVDRNAVVTGKPLSLGGSLGRESATGRGAFFVLKEAYKEQGKELKGATAAIQGFGNVGYYIAENMQDAGVKVTAISTVDGAVHNPDGIDIKALKAYENEHGSIKGFPGAEPMDSNKLLESDVDILVPAALGHAINESNADRITASMILECANHPTTPKADEILNQKNITVLPDILANAGGVTVSYYEWVQNMQHIQWTEEEIDTKLKDKMTNSYQAVSDLAKEKQISLRDAAYMRAIQAVVNADKDRGYI